MSLPKLTMKTVAEQLILERAEESGVDVLDSEFVDYFAKKTGAKLEIRMYGANWCPYLSRTLTRMYQEGKLNRWAEGLPNMTCSGFPRWVYCYTINHDYCSQDI